MSRKKATRSLKKSLGNSIEVLAAESRGDVGEGIETEAERGTLQALVAPWGQGFHMGPPEDITSSTSPINEVR